MANETNKRWFFRNTDRPDAQAEDTTPTFRYFFKLLWRKVGKLLSLNLLMVIQVIPLVAAALIYIMGPTTPTAQSPLYAPLIGTQIAGNSPVAGLLLNHFGEQLDVPVLTTGRLVAIVILVGFTVLTWGWQNVGGTYNLRSLVRGDSCFLLSDYFYAIKRNLKQGFFFGLIDAFLIFLIVFDILYFYPLSYEFGYGVMYAITVFLGILYLVMRFYIYPMLITFDLSIKKLFKNALLFTMLGIKRNLAMLLGFVILIAANIAMIVGGLSVGFSVPLILPFFYLITLLGFIAMYCVWPNIKRYMIDPYDDGKDEEMTEEQLPTPEAGD
ncbi:MAG: hypothetical protein E7663_00740 [Ruminococcaceae bacterium]|nr:hypothetical protein [Oscillospiraceae bacterium]